MARQRKYSPEVRKRAVRRVREHGPEHPSQWAAITSIASTFGCTPETLRNLVRQAERDSGQRGGLTTDERQRLKELERDNSELRRPKCGASSSTIIVRPRGWSRSAPCFRSACHCAVDARYSNPPLQVAAFR